MINKHYKNISYNDLKLMIQSQDVIIIDVRTEKEFERSHVRNSKNIPLDIFENEIERIIKNKNSKIIVYCAAGVRSTVACDILMKKNYTSVYNVFKGIKELN